MCVYYAQKGPIMKKNFLLLFTTFLLFTLTATGCSNRVSGNLGKDGAKLVGTWNGVGNALGRDDSYNCDYLSFSIDKEGQFTLKDITQNKTCLSGGLSADSSKFSLNTGSETAVGLPSGWDDLGSGSTLSYTMPSENILVLTYDNVSYLFKKYKKGTQSDSANTTGPLLNLTENDVWYSNEDFTTDTNRYKLSLYDNYMELHSLDEKAATENEPAFVTNFFYLSSRDNEFTFYTYKDDSMNLPAVFKDLPNGFSKCTMKTHAENNSLTLSYKGQNLLFTNK